MVPWMEPEEVEIPQELIAYFEGNRILASILFHRGMTTPATAKEFLYPEQMDLPRFHPLLDVEIAGERVAQAIKNAERILIWGDGDVDGVMATAILLERLRSANAKVSYYLPKRGHGLSLSKLKSLLPENRVLITCDTGMNSQRALQYALDQGVDVILTDHHALTESIPAPATYRINSSSLPIEDFYKPISGAGIAFCWMKEFERGMGLDPLPQSALDWVALGTLADRLELVQANRLFVKEGLKIIRAFPRPSLLALFRNVGLNLEGVNEEHLLLHVIPRFNAYLRYRDASMLVEFLLSNDAGMVREVASDMEGFYAKQMVLVRQVYQSAMKLLESQMNEEQLRAIFLTNPHWPREVLGMVASRMVETLGKPVFLATSGASRELSGTARAPGGVHLLEAFREVKPFIVEYYGHAHAVGFRVHSERWQEMQRQFLMVFAERKMGKEHPWGVDARVQLGHISSEFVNQLERMGPFGPGNPRPKFLHQKVVVQKVTPIGRNNEGLAVTVKDSEGKAFQLVYWLATEKEFEEDSLHGEIDLIYSVRGQDFRARNRVTFILETVRPHHHLEGQPFSKLPSVKVLDWRGNTQLISRINSLQEDVCIWAEGDWKRSLGVKDISWHTYNRLGLRLCETLVILTAPPGRQVLQEALMNSRPRTVILCALDPCVDEFQEFLHRFLGVVKSVLSKKGGTGSFAELAAAMAHQPETVRFAFFWLHRQGLIHILHQENDEFKIEGGSEPVKSVRAPQKLRELLDEARAYRLYFQQVSVASLFLQLVEIEEA